MLKVSGLSAWYGKSHVVRNVALEVAPSQVVGILGRNGVGKTTIIKTIMGMIRQRAGEVTLDGRPIHSLSADLISRAGVGYVPQGRQLFPHLTVRENFQLAWHGRKFGSGEVERAIAHFPPLRNLLSRLSGTLSGGEQQMVAIGRALLNAPRVILLDEPTEGLSPLFVGTVRDVMVGMREDGIAVLLVEQNLNMALGICQHIYFVEKGTVAHQCPAQEARTTDVVERYLGVHVA